MRVDALSKGKCCGCGLCVELCPVKAISMIADQDGFKFPSIDNSKCIDCGVCFKKCSFVNNELEENPDFYIARSKDQHILKNSASGGVFSTIANQFIEEGYVYGAAYDRDYCVHHIEGHDELSLTLMRDSKYIQSSIEEVFSQIEKRVREDTKVLFSGTPCQCNAVLSFLKCKHLDRTKVLLIDVICHGVGSPQLWSDYLSYVQEKNKLGQIISIRTRNKEKGDGYHMTIKGKKCSYYKEGELDPYICLFNKSLIYRNSCYQCPYKSWNRVSDITIGDFRKVKKYFPQFADGKGISVVICNTNLGREYMRNVSSYFNILSASRESASQVNLTGEINLDEHARNVFYNNYHHKSIKSIFSSYTNEGLLNRLIYVTLESIKSFIKLFYKK